MDAKTIEVLKALKFAIDTTLNAVSQADSAETEAEEKVVKTAPAKVEPAEVEIEAELTKEILDGMTYNNLKKLAKERGVSAVGNRDDITARLLNKDTEAEVEETTEEPESKKIIKFNKEEAEAEAEDIDSNDEIYVKVEKAVEGMSNEEIADVLAECGISAKGKRQALIDKVVVAVKDGIIDLDDDDESDTEEAEDDTKYDGEVPEELDEYDDLDDYDYDEEEAKETSSEDEEDRTNDTTNPDMTAARKKAIIAKDEEIRDNIESGELSRDDLVEFLQNFYDTDDEMSDVDDDELIDTYIDAVCRLIDDEGNLVEGEAYSLNGEPACCGRVLKFVEETNSFVCEACGSEYEVE